MDQKIRDVLDTVLSKHPHCTASDWAIALITAGLEQAKRAGVPEHNVAEGFYSALRISYGPKLAPEPIERELPEAHIHPVRDHQARLETEGRCYEIARLVKEELLPKQGFILFTFDVDGSNYEHLAYATTQGQEHAVALLSEWIDKMGIGGAVLLEPSPGTCTMLRNMLPQIDVSQVRPEPHASFENREILADQAAGHLSDAAEHLALYQDTLKLMLQKGKG